MQHGDYQLEIYGAGLGGRVPPYPMTFDELERRAELALPPSIWSYVAGGAGDERTQRANADAFGRWGLGRCDLPQYAEHCDRVRVVRDLSGLENTTNEMAESLIGR